MSCSLKILLFHAINSSRNYFPETRRQQCNSVNGPKHPLPYKTDKKKKKTLSPFYVHMIA